ALAPADGLPKPLPAGTGRLRLAFRHRGSERIAGPTSAASLIHAMPPTRQAHPLVQVTPRVRPLFPASPSQDLTACCASFLLHGVVVRICRAAEKRIHLL